MKNNKLSIFIAAISLLAACKPNLTPKTVTNGTANFTKYVAVGNSLTAGYTDGALMRIGQEESYPVMLSKQFAMAGGGAFKTPWLSEAGNGNGGQGETRFVMAVNNGELGPVRASGPATNIFDSATIRTGGPYNHLGVPGIRAIDAMMPIYGLFNPFQGRLGGIGTSLLSEAMRNDATFFTLWLGSNDVLGYATAGAVGGVIDTPYQINLANYAGTVGTLVHPDMVAGAISVMLDSLTKNGAKGAIANIPDVTSTPYFTTIPYNGLVLSQAQADALNANYATYNTFLPATEQINFVAGPNPFVIYDAKMPAPAFARQAKSSELILLTASTPIKVEKFGSVKPLSDSYVLDKDELPKIQSYTSAYNAKIQQLATAKGLAYVDMNSYMKTFSNGLRYNGVDLSAKFVTGGGFGLDGVHPTARGYALIANQFIQAINAKYGSTVPMVDPLQYRGNQLP